MYRCRKREAKALLLVLCLQLAPTLFAQYDLSKVDHTDLQRYVTTLASPEFEGRLTGTEGEKKTVSFLVEQFERLGLKTSLEHFKVMESRRGETWLKTANGRLLEDFKQIIFQGTDHYDEPVKREVVFGGNGTDEELARLDVKGRLVLVFATDRKVEFALSKQLLKRGAEGLILVPLYNKQRFESEKRRLKEYRYRLHYQLEGEEVSPKIRALIDSIRTVNVLTLPVSEVKNLMGYSRKQLSKAIDSKRIEEIPPVTVEIKFSMHRRIIECYNVIGLIQGESDRMISLSAHYDHLGKRAEVYYPGADDNASGVAALLELAELFADRTDLRHSIQFVAFAAEEEGLFGSTHHVNRLDFVKEQVVCNVNMDMIARTDEDHADDDPYLYSLGSTLFESLHPLLQRADSLYNDCYFDYSLNSSEGLFFLYEMTDNGNYYEKGIPALLFISGTHPDYHEPSDTADKINYKLLESRVRQIALVVELLQQEGVSE